jgi:hypothetical protein
VQQLLSKLDAPATTVGGRGISFRSWTVEMLLKSHVACSPGTPRSAPRLTALLMLLCFCVGSCRSSAPSGTRYVVTATPINVVGPRHPGTCIAVDPSDEHGVWWWQPGPSGCSTSINRPTVFRAQQATVVRTGADGVNVRFQLQLHVGGPRDVVLLLQDGGLRDLASGMRVSIAHRGNLDIPPAYGR